MSLDFLAGCMGGMAGVLVGHPLDTVKILLQTQDPLNSRYKGTMHCMRSLVVKEGFRGLYKGVGSPLMGVAGINAIVFGVYGNIQRSMTDSDSLKSHAIAGLTAGLAQCVITSPMELIKSRIQIAENISKQTTLNCFKKIYASEGIRGVYKGFGITALREGPAFTTYFVSYELLTRTNCTEPVPTWKMLLAGGVAGVLSWSVCYPVDVIKTRIQTTPSKYTSSLDCLQKTIASGGYSSLFRGLTPTLIRAFPVNAVTFTLVTWTMRLFDMVENQHILQKSERAFDLLIYGELGAAMGNF